MSQITIYHNPDCGTSRNVLGLIRNSGEEPTIIEYLKTPPDRETLKTLIAAMGARADRPRRRDRARLHTTRLEDRSHPQPLTDPPLSQVLPEARLATEGHHPITALRTAAAARGRPRRSWG